MPDTYAAVATLDEHDVRRIVRDVLTEDDFGDYGGMGDYGGGGGGDMWPGSLYKILVEPFVDVGKVAMGAAEDITSKGRRVIETAMQGLASVVIPGLAAEYDTIKKAEQKRAAEIKQKYGAVLKRIDEAFEGDALGFAFMLAPAHFITKTVLEASARPLTKSAARALLATIDTVTGRLDTVTSMTDKVRKMLGLGTEKKGGGDDDVWGDLMKSLGTESRADDGQLLSEKKGGQKKAAAIMKRLIEDPRVQEALAGSDILGQMKSDTEAVVSGTLMSLVGLAEAVTAAKSLQELGKAVGKPLALPKELQGQDAAKAEAMATAQVKKGAKALLVTQMTREVEALKRQGIDADHPYVRAYVRAIEKVKAA